MSVPAEDSTGKTWNKNTGHPMLVPVITMVIGFLLFSTLVILYTTWAVASSEHKWCSVMDELNAAPAPATPLTRAEKTYEQQLAYDLRALESKLGC